LYVWAFIVAVNQPIDFISILFFICAVVYFFTTVLPLIISLFQNRSR
jgi:hypothetical protein